MVYECPHCRGGLEASPGPWNGWRLCPRCGRAGLPPRRTASLKPKSARRPPPGPPARGVFVTQATADLARSRVVRTSIALAVLTLAALFAFIAYQGQVRLDMVVLGLLAAALVGLLKYVGKKGRK